MTCGKHAGLYKIAGGIDNDTLHGRRMAGTLHSFSTCPCKARFIPSIMQDTYETSSTVEDNHDDLDVHRDVRQASPVSYHPGASPESLPPPVCSRLPAIRFSQNYKAERGDLVYGGSSERWKYVGELYPGYQVDDKKLPPLVIDVYNNNVSATILMDDENLTVSQFVNSPEILVKKIVIPPHLDTKVRKYRDGPDYLWSEYFSVGEYNPKFNIEAIYREVAEHYGKDNYHEMYTAMPPLMGYVPKLLWKRGSKLGIEMTAQNASHHLHFVLDGLLIEHIVNKTPPHGLSITASELRYAYRNRERLKGKIHFYQDRHEVHPPWVSDPKLWKSYKPRNAQHSSAPQSADVREPVRTFADVREPVRASADVRKPVRASATQRMRSWFKRFRHKKV